MPPRPENPHIPKYIKDAPWYSDKPEDSTDSLAHHRNKDSVEDNAAPRIGTGIHDDFVPTIEKKVIGFKKRQKKGRCKNCGGDHDKTDCMEAPKRKGQNTPTGSGGGKGKRNEDVDYDGKRDRWYGYDVGDYNKYISSWEKKEEAKNAEGGEEREYDTDEEIELKELGLWEEYSKENYKKVEGEKTIRLREDKAVYLKDVRNETITYDPKSRAIRDDSTGYFNEKNLFVRHLTGEAKKIEDTMKFAWDENKRGLNEPNVISNPTLAGKKIKLETELQKANRLKLKKSLLDKYGTSNDGDSDVEVEDQDDSNLESDVIRSKYAEDVYPGNHTSVWGSYYLDGKWGYKCCKSLDRNSLCK